MISKEQVERHLQGLERGLISKGNRQKALLTDEWLEQVPPSAGAYVAFEKGEVVYVGETGNLKRRMRDLRDSRNHSLRRSIGRLNMSEQAGYKQATTSSRFPRHIEEQVDRWVRTRIQICCVKTQLGRKELEEGIYRKYKPKYNMRGPRKTP